MVQVWQQTVFTLITLWQELDDVSLSLSELSEYAIPGKILDLFSPKTKKNNL